MHWKLSEREPSVEELLTDEIMVLMMRSAGIDAEELLALLRRTENRRSRRNRSDGAGIVGCALA